MKKYTRLILTISLLASFPMHAAWAAPDWAVKKVGEVFPYLESKLEKDTFEFFKGIQGKELKDLRRLLLNYPGVSWDGDPEYANYHTKLMALRVKFAHRGEHLGRWRDWEYDGLTPAAGDQKFIQGVEKRLSFLKQMHRQGYGYHTKTQEKITELEKVLQRPEFTQSKVLAAYKQNFVMPQLKGAKFLSQEHRVLYVGRELRDIRNRIKNRTPGSQTQLKQIHERAAKVLKIIHETNAHGYKLSEHSVSLDPRDPLSESWSLDKVQAELVKITKMK